MPEPSLPAFPHPYREVVAIRNTSVDLGRILEDDEPVLFPGLLAGHASYDQIRACDDDRAILSHLAETFGDREVQSVVITSGGRLAGDDKPVVRMPFADLARTITAELGTESYPRHYMQNQPVTLFPELAWTLPVATPATWEHAYSGLWLGSGGQTVMLHYDNSFNFICMLNGYKRISLLPYDVLPDLYATFDPATNVMATTVRLLDADLERYPRFRRALEKLRVVVVKPGDVLFVPPHWWHHVESFGLNVMISNWGAPFPLADWRVMGAKRAELCLLLDSFEPDWIEHYARRFEDEVLRIGAPSTPPPTSTSPAGRVRAEELLRETARLFERVPDAWRRHAKVSFDYFAFQRHGDFEHVPGGRATFIAQLRTMVDNGARLSPLG